MVSLERTLRKKLEKTVREARGVAVAGARKALAELRVGDADAPKDLTPEQRLLRNSLRAHARQLSDRRDAKTGAQDTARLVQECAYEHWHRMLFARFLAEADLLIEPESGVAISLDEVQELALEKGADWLELASDYAERMLPQIFRKADPVLRIALPPESRSDLEDLLKRLPRAVFEAEDSLGWVYQFWQAERKEEVDDFIKSGGKADADELPAVTQLFTEDYMVLFLLHNTLGAWWAGKVLAANPDLAANAADENPLRAACKVGDVEWTYLRFVREKTEDGAEGPWRPAAGTFEGWPKRAKDITVLDPCMGSGHFLVFALPILVAFRISEEGLSEAAAIEAVLRDNLFGLEIDQRCTQIAAFNLAFAAWRRVGHRRLPPLNLACSGLAIGVTMAEWLKLAEKAVMAVDPAAKRDLFGVERNLLTVGLEERVKNGLEALYDLFAQAPWLGSLIDPGRAGADIFREGFDKLEPLLTLVLAAADTDETREMAVAAQGMAKAAELMGRRFTIVATNVPFLTIRKHPEQILRFGESMLPSSRNDLATMMLDRWFRSALSAATVSLHQWMFQVKHTEFRRNLLAQYAIKLIADIGEGGFESRSASGAFVCLSVVTPLSRTAGGSCFATIDAKPAKEPVSKSDELASSGVGEVQQSGCLAAKAHTITLVSLSTGSSLARFALCLQGTSTGDNDRFLQFFWEHPSLDHDLVPFHMPPDSKGRALSGACNVVNWAVLLREGLPAVRGEKAWRHQGIIFGKMRSLPFCRYHGHHFSNSAPVVIPRDPLNLPAIWAFAASGELESQLRKLNPAVAVENGYLGKIPFNLALWGERARESASLKLPELAEDAVTSWGYGGGVSGDSPMHVGTAQLLGYRWPRQCGFNLTDWPPTEPGTPRAQRDGGGVICVPALQGEAPAEQRLNALLADAFGAEWSAALLASLLADVGYAGKTLDDWLRDGFFAQHCELFHQRPFIWHIWDGRRDGFHALVNYHRLAAPNGEGRQTLEKLIYSYLGDWIDRQRAEERAGIEGADARVAHAEHLKSELIRILEGEPPHDIFVRWKPLYEQPIGWEPDINDGVRMNIRPFMTARPLGTRGANASILRASPKIKWEKDRGKEPDREKEDYPWFWSWDQSTQGFAGGGKFDGNRWNALHYSRAAKAAARARHRAKSGAAPP